MQRDLRNLGSDSLKHPVPACEQLGLSSDPLKHPVPACGCTVNTLVTTGQNDHINRKKCP